MLKVRKLYFKVLIPDYSWKNWKTRQHEGPVCYMAVLARAV